MFHQISCFDNLSALVAQFHSKINSYTVVVTRLNSGNFRIFDFADSIMNLDGSVCRAWKIITIDTKISLIPWETDIRTFWNFYILGTSRWLIFKFFWWKFNYTKKLLGGPNPGIQPRDTRIFLKVYSKVFILTLCLAHRRFAKWK